MNLISITKAEKRLIELIRDVGYGEVKIRIQNSEPVIAEQIIKSVKLDNN